MLLELPARHHSARTHRWYALRQVEIAEHGASCCCVVAWHELKKVQRPARNATDCRLTAQCCSLTALQLIQKRREVV
jgi:hypothetical protein